MIALLGLNLDLNVVTCHWQSKFKMMIMNYTQMEMLEMKSTLIGFSLGYTTQEKTKGINLLSIISPKQKVYSIRVAKF